MGKETLEEATMRYLTRENKNLVERKQSVTETESETKPKYIVCSYYDIKCHGFEDELKTDDWSETILFAHDKLMNGFMVEIENTKTGKYKRINPDEYIETFDGEFIVRPEELEETKLVESDDEDLPEEFYEKICRAYIDTQNLEWVVVNPENNNSVVHGYFVDDKTANKWGYGDKITSNNFKMVAYDGLSQEEIDNLVSTLAGEDEYYEYDTWEDFYNEYVYFEILEDLEDFGLDDFYISKEDLTKLGIDLSDFEDNDLIEESKSLTETVETNEEVINKAMNDEEYLDYLGITKEDVIKQVKASKEQFDYISKYVETSGKSFAELYDELGGWNLDNPDKYYDVDNYFDCYYQSLLITVKAKDGKLSVSPKDVYVYPSDVTGEPSDELFHLDFDVPIDYTKIGKQVKDEDYEKLDETKPLTETVDTNEDVIIKTMQDKDFLKILDVSPLEIIDQVKLSKAQFDELDKMIKTSGKSFDELYDELGGWNLDNPDKYYDVDNYFDCYYKSLLVTVKVKDGNLMLSPKDVYVYPSDISGEPVDELFHLDFDEPIDFDKIENQYNSTKKTEAVEIDTVDSILQQIADKYKSVVEVDRYGDKFVDVARPAYKKIIPEIKMEVVTNVKVLQDFIESLGFNLDSIVDIGNGKHTYTYINDNNKLDIVESELVYQVYVYNNKKTESKYPKKIKTHDGYVLTKVNDGLPENANIPEYMNDNGDVTLVPDVDKYEILEEDASDKSIWEKVEKIVDEADNDLYPDSNNDYEYDAHIVFNIYRDAEFEDIFVVTTYLDGEIQDELDTGDVHLEDLDRTLVDIVKKLYNKQVQTESMSLNNNDFKNLLDNGNVVTVGGKQNYTPTDFYVDTNKIVWYKNGEISFGWEKHPSMNYEDLINHLDKMQKDGFTVEVSRVKPPKVEESKSLKTEGAGAGYELSGSIDDAKVNTFKIGGIEKNDYDERVVILSCDVDVKIADMTFSSYEYGGKLDFPIDAKIVKMRMMDNDTYEGGEEPEINDYNVRDALNGTKFKTMLGGGWSHVTFTGEFNTDAEGNMYSSYFYTDNLDIVILDKHTVDFIDKKVSGRLDEMTYCVMDKDNGPVDDFDDKDEAIKYAKENGYDEVVERYHDYVLIDAEGSIDDNSYEEGNVVWSRTDESKSIKTEDESKGVKTEGDNPDVEKHIMEYLESNQLYPSDVFVADDRVMVDISWGDWKHDHLRCDDLMEDLGYALVEEEVTEEDGSDCYSAIRHYIPKGSISNLDESVDTKIAQDRKRFIDKWKDHKDFKCSWCGTKFTGNIDNEGRMPNCPHCMEDRYAEDENKAEDGHANKDVHFCDSTGEEIYTDFDGTVIKENKDLKTEAENDLEEKSFDTVSDMYNYIRANNIKVMERQNRDGKIVIRYPRIAGLQEDNKKSIKNESSSSVDKAKALLDLFNELYDGMGDMYAEDEWAELLASDYDLDTENMEADKLIITALNKMDDSAFKDEVDNFMLGLFENDGVSYLKDTLHVYPRNLKYIIKCLNTIKPYASEPDKIDEVIKELKSVNLNLRTTAQDFAYYLYDNYNPFSVLGDTTGPSHTYVNLFEVPTDYDIVSADWFNYNNMPNDMLKYIGYGWKKDGNNIVADLIGFTYNTVGSGAHFNMPPTYYGYSATIDSSNKEEKFKEMANALMSKAQEIKKEYKLESKKTEASTVEGDEYKKLCKEIQFQAEENNIDITEEQVKKVADKICYEDRYFFSNSLPEDEEDWSEVNTYILQSIKTVLGLQEDKEVKTEAPIVEGDEYKKLCKEIQFQADENNIDITEEQVKKVADKICYEDKYFFSNSLPEDDADWSAMNTYILQSIKAVLGLQEDYKSLDNQLDKLIAKDATDKEFNDFLEKASNDDTITNSEYTELVKKAQDTRRINEGKSIKVESKLSDDIQNDPEYREYVVSLLKDGAIDDPEYVNGLSTEEFDDLVTNTWMKDIDVINSYIDAKNLNEGKSIKVESKYDTMAFAQLLPMSFTDMVDNDVYDRASEIFDDGGTNEDVVDYYIDMFKGYIEDDKEALDEFDEDLAKKYVEYKMNTNLTEKKVTENVDINPSDARNVRHAVNYIVGGYYNCIQDNTLEYLPKSLQDLIDEIYESSVNNEYDVGYCGYGRKTRTRLSSKEAIVKYIKELLRDEGDVMAIAEEQGWDLSELDESKSLTESGDNTDDTNIANIKDILVKSGIKNERTLDLMSKDVLRTLKSNYADDCSVDGIYYGVAITDAIQKVIERITGTKPSMKFTEGKSIKCEDFVMDDDRTRFINKMINQDKNSIEDFLGYDIDDNLYDDKQGLRLAIAEIYDQMPEEELSKFTEGKSIKCESTNKKVITITDGTNSTELDYNSLYFGIVDYFYNGNETGAQIGFYWNEYKNTAYINGLYLTVYVGNESNEDLETLDKTLRNLTPNEPYKVTLSDEDYKTFLDWKAMCDKTEFTYWNNLFEDKALDENATDDRFNSTIESWERLGYKLYKQESTITVLINDSKDMPIAIAFNGKASKPIWHYKFSNMDDLDSYVNKSIENAKAREQSKADRKAQRKLTSEHDIKVGDIFYTSWGYDQTNTEFYEVVNVRGSRIDLKEIGYTVDYEKASYGREDITPVPHKFVNDIVYTVSARADGTVTPLDGKSFLQLYKYAGGSHEVTATGWGH